MRFRTILEADSRWFAHWFSSLNDEPFCTVATAAACAKIVACEGPCINRPIVGGHEPFFFLSSPGEPRWPERRLSTPGQPPVLPYTAPPLRYAPANFLIRASMQLSCLPAATSLGQWYVPRNFLLLDVAQMTRQMLKSIIQPLRSVRCYSVAPAHASQAQKPTVVRYPYFVSRTPNGTLPVYSDIRNTKYILLIRNVAGDINVCVTTEMITALSD